MTGFPRSPRLRKGAIVGADPFNPLASVVVFQYNPATLERRIQPRRVGEEAERGEVLRLGGPPRETIAVEIELDATDGLESGDAIVEGTGIAPQLAALEMLVSPKSAYSIANEALEAAGTIEVLPPEAPLTVFAWGPKRVVPVRVDELSVTEQAFDPTLSPILATVRFSLSVLTYRDLGLASVGGALSLAHQVITEGMATVAGARGLPAVRNVIEG